MAALRHSNIIDGVRYKGCLIQRDLDGKSESKSSHWCTIQVNEGKVRIECFADAVVSRGEGVDGICWTASDEVNANRLWSLQCG